MHTETPENHETPGLPFGELFREPCYLRGDLRLLRRAIREGWPIPEASRTVLVEWVSSILHERETLPEGVRDRATIAALWVVLDMEGANQRDTFEALGEPLRGLRPHRRRYT